MKAGRSYEFSRAVPGLGMVDQFEGHWRTQRVPRVGYGSVAGGDQQFAVGCHPADVDHLRPDELLSERLASHMATKAVGG